MIAATSEPAPGSETPIAPISSPAIAGAIQLVLISSLASSARIASANSDWAINETAVPTESPFASSSASTAVVEKSCPLPPNASE